MDFSKILASFEEFIYEIFIWLLLLPKTLTKIIVNPRWIVKYINQQVTDAEEEGLKKKFNNYLSPILLWLLLVGLTTIFYFNQYVKAIDISIAYLNQYPFINEAEKVLTTKKFNDVQLWLDSLNIIFVAFYLTSILIFSVVLQILQKGDISHTAIRKNIYIQFYCFAPLQFMINLNASYQVSNFNITELFQQLMRGQMPNHHTSAGLLLGVLAAVSFIWFLIAEAIVIKNILKKSWLHAVSVIILSFLASIVFLFVLILITSPFTSDMASSIKERFK